MKRYAILILSFILSIIVFVILIICQKKIVNEENFVQAYSISQNIDIHSNITMDMLEPIYIHNDNSIYNEVYNDIENIEMIASNKNLSKGKILLNSDVIDKKQLETSVENLTYERVIIPISNVDEGLKSILTDNAYINLYITVDKDYEPIDIENYEKVLLKKEDKDNITFLYLNKIKPICFLDEDGKVVNDKNIVRSLVVELDKKQAMYINYIKGKAGFNITGI